MAEIPNPTTRNQRKRRGTKRSKGNPTNPEEAERQKNAKTRETETTKILGERLREHVELMEVDVQRARGQHERKKSSNTKRTKNRKTHRLSSVSPPQPCRPKKKKVVVTAHPPLRWGTPKPLTIQIYKQGPELEGPKLQT